MLVLYQLNKGVKKSTIAQFDILLPELETLKKLTNILALADALLAHHPRSVDFNVTYENKTVICHFKKHIAYLAEESVTSLSHNEIPVKFTH